MPVSIKEAVNNAHSRWMDSDDQDSRIVVSSRVRIARNLAGLPFPHLIEEKAGEVIRAVRMALDHQEAAEQLRDLELCGMSELSPIERQILVDKHLISPALLKDPQDRGVILRDDEVVSIMINEEDHLRIQCLLPGLQLMEAWRIVSKIDDGLEMTLDYAFSDTLGYLTSCPTNTGSGMRASVMLHLPGLKLTKQLAGVLSTINKLGLTVRGLYGEGTEALGDLFQVSNQITLGQTEEEICNNLTTTTRQLLSQEQAAREALYKDHRDQIEDRVFRAYAIFKYARVLTSEEVMRLISDLRLGITLDIISVIPARLLNELMVKIRPAFLLKIAGQKLISQQRDVFRAELVRQEFAGFNI